MEHLRREQLAELLRQAREHPLRRSAGERDWILFLVSFWHGLRASEAVSLTPANFQVGGRETFLEIQRLKGSLRTVQPLVDDPDPLLNERAGVEAWLAGHAERCGVTPGLSRYFRLFPISRVQFWRLAAYYGHAAGLPGHLRHPHVLKHSIAMQTIRGAGIENVRQYLGHRSIQSTGAYLAVDDDAASAAIRGAARREPA